MCSGVQKTALSWLPAVLLVALVAHSCPCLAVPLEVESFGPSVAVARVGDEVVFRGTVKNAGDEPARSVEARVLLDGSSFEPSQTLSLLDPDDTASFEWPFSIEREMSSVAEMVIRADNADTISSVSYFTALPERPSPADVVLEGENVKLAFTCTVYGYGPATLFVRRGTAWRELARLMSLSRIAYRSEDGEVHRRLICGEIASDRKPSALFAKDLVDADGDVWHFMFRFTVGEDGKSILAEYTLRTEEDEELLAFGGPAVYVGDGTTGEEKHDALFPGLEYLESDEPSSSVLDVNPPHNVRRVPHPNRITIPLMAVNVRQHLIGLTWDPFQKWDGINDRPCALFASPNRFENMACNVLALFVPSCPGWVAENATESAQPYRLRAGEEVKLVAEIFSDYPAESSIDAVRRWIDLNGVPEPLRLPQGALEDEIDFSLTAYTHTLWVEEEGKWHDTLDLNPSSSRLIPEFVHQLLLGARHTVGEEQRELYRARVSSALGAMSGIPLGLDLAFVGGRLKEALAAEATRIRELMGEQRPGGDWVFDPEKSDRRDTVRWKDYHLLGNNGDVEVGTCADSAYRTLKFARISADPEALAAGLKALEYMRRFRVPRGAQVREVPVHAPNLLAAAHAVRAYLEGYNFTGDRNYLDDAVRWAWAGVPFVYMWNKSDMPYMRYASIPVFGATRLTDSWFGRAAQLSGLDYAYALFKLAKHDGTLPWGRIATGITISAMYQQEDSGEYLALYPDYYDLVTGSVASCRVNPSGILRNIFTLLDDDPDAKTVILRRDGEKLHISSGARIENARHWRRGVSSDLVLPRGETSYAIAVPIGPPDKVTANRGLLKQVMDIDMADEAWSYDEENEALFIKIMHRQERMRVVVRSASG